MNEHRAPEVARVCHVIHELGPGGAEKLLVDAARLAPDVGIELSVISLMPFGDHPYPRVLAELGVPVHSLDLSSRWDLRGRRRLRSIVQDIGPDVLHTHLKHADLLGAHAVRGLDIAHVSTLHVIEDAVGPAARMKRDAGARVRERSALCTIAVSEAVRRWYLETFPFVAAERVVVVRNGVPAPEPISEERRVALRAEFGVGDDGLLVPMVALMRPGKGHEDLIAAAGLIASEVPVTFVLAGSGSEEARLRETVDAAALADRVRFAGFRSDIPDLLAAADFVVHPTHADALPTALVQAAAAGIPSIGTKVGGVPEVVDAETGIMVPVADPPALAAATVELASDPDRRRWLGKRARERFDEQYEGGVWIR
ncbi:MAG TPA: glycosyltransferase, partial [Acidimicrobiia bacterium]|nr:glycosyltransferase [Acidimicrobiia bacterium]